jgi:hypothetical protein
MTWVLQLPKHLRVGSHKTQDKNFTKPKLPKPNMKKMLFVVEVLSKHDTFVAWSLELHGQPNPLINPLCFTKIPF